MEMTGEHRIPAPRQRVWEALNDPAVLQSCIPGCESLEKVGDNQMTAAVRMRIGPVSAKFSGKVTLSDIDPPNGYRISGEGQGGAAGFAKGGATVALSEDGSDTVLTYKAEAQVGGKLAQIGSRLIDGAASKLADEFFVKFAEHLGGGQQDTAAMSETGAGGPPAAAGASAGGTEAAVMPDAPTSTFAAVVTPASPASAAGTTASGPGVSTGASTASAGSAASMNATEAAAMPGAPMSAAEAAAHNARASADSASRGLRHWLAIGAGVVVLVIVYLAVR